jgi:hypothetical protein
LFYEPASGHCAVVVLHEGEAKHEAGPFATPKPSGFRHLQEGKSSTPMILETKPADRSLCFGFGDDDDDDKEWILWISGQTFTSQITL